MSSELSALSLVASGIYGIVVLACALAAATAWQLRQAPGHVRTWLAIALFFAALVVLRLVAAEDLLRTAFRASLQASGAYEQRREFQAPIVAAIFALAAIGGLALLYRMARHLRGRRNVARLTATIASFAMVFLIALRLASLHAIDGLLYGPIKLNWLIDMASSMAVLIAAIVYARIVRARP